MTTRADEIAEWAAFLARTFGVRAAISNGHSMYSLVDNDVENRMRILYTTDGGVSITIGQNQALLYYQGADLNELCNGFGDELERRLGLTAQEVSI